MITPYFKPGELVKVLEKGIVRCLGFQRGHVVMSSGASPLLLGIVIAMNGNETYNWCFVHLQNGNRVWFVDDEIRKATDDDTTI